MYKAQEGAEGGQPGPDAGAGAQGGGNAEGADDVQDVEFEEVK